MPDETPGPLTETVFYVLLALHTPLHGYGVMKYVNEISDGRIALGAGTLYGALTTLAEKGWIASVPGSAGERKKNYVVTDEGRSIVLAELKRLDELVRNGQRVIREESK